MEFFKPRHFSVFHERRSDHESLRIPIRSPDEKLEDISIEKTLRRSTKVEIERIGSVGVNDFLN